LNGNDEFQYELDVKNVEPLAQVYLFLCFFSRQEIQVNELLNLIHYSLIKLFGLLLSSFDT
jgi:hypothetical protein